MRENVQQAEQVSGLKLRIGRGMNPVDVENSPALECGKCGAPLPQVSPQAVVARMRKHTNLALMVALVAGFFNVFGLGHIILKSYIRGIMFIVMGVVIWYLNGWNLFGGGFTVTLLTVAVYFYQAIDVTRVAMTPEDR